MRIRAPPSGGRGGDREKTVHQPVLFLNILEIKQVNGFLFFFGLPKVIFLFIIMVY